MKSPNGYETGANVITSWLLILVGFITSPHLEKLEQLVNMHPDLSKIHRAADPQIWRDRMIIWLGAVVTGLCIVEFIWLTGPIPAPIVAPGMAGFLTDLNISINH